MPTLALVAALAPLALVPLTVDADGRRERVEGEVHRDVRRARGRGGRREVAGLRVDVGGEPPRGERLDALVADAAHVEPGVDHLALLAHGDHVRQLRTRQPHREADVHRALVGPHPDPGEEPGVGDGAVGVEVIALRPGGVALHRVGEDHARASSMGMG